MATIKSSLALYDGMTGTIRKIHDAMNTLIDTFENVQDVSSKVIDTTALQKARGLVTDSIAEWDRMEESIRGAGEAQDQFNDRVRDGANAADDLGGKLKGILATVISIAGVKSALGWAQENMKLADTQRNAENQLKAVLANMGVEDVQIPVTVETNADEAINKLNTYADTLNSLEDSKISGSVSLDTGAAMNELNAYSDRLTAVDGSAVNTALLLETGGVLSTAKTFEDWQNRINGTTIETALTLDSVGAMAGITAYNDRLNVLDGTTAETTIAVAVADSMINVNNFENTLEALDGQKVNTTITANSSSAIKALNQYDRVANAVDGSTVQTMLNMDTGQALTAAMEYDDWANQTDGRTIQNTILLNTPDQPGDLEAALTLNTGGAVAAYNDFVNTVDGNTITTAVTVDNTQAISAFDAITAKASEIQGRGIYGDEAMIAGAAEFATYFTDAEAIMSMMDTLSNYAMGMSGGGALDSSAMVDYATNLGKIMTGTYTAMSQKGFEFTDAQKAVIEGTATEAQYVEALGAEYASMSEDMRAATVINDIIAESWDGLYEAMSNTPEGKIIQFQNRLGDVREILGNQLYPTALHFFDVFTQKFPQIETVLTGFTAGLSTLITVLTWIATLGLDVATVFTENWSWIGPIIGGVAAALLVYNGYLLATNTLEAISNGLKAVAAARSALKAGMTIAEAAATTTATGAQVGLNAALLACPVTWIVVGIIAIIAALYAAVGAINHFADKSYSATGFIAGLFAVLAAHVINTFIVPFWNALAAIANFIGNVFNDPVAAVEVLFYDMALTVIGYIVNMAHAIEDVINKIPGVTVDITSGLDNFYNGLEQAQQKVKDEAGWVEYVKKMDFIDYGDAATAGYKFGEGVEDKLSGLFKMPTLDEMGFDNNDAFNLGNTLDGIYGNTGDTAANTAATADTLDYMDEDLAWMKDIAEREAINRYVTAEITVEQHNENHISKDTDLDGVMDAFCFDFAEKLDVSAEGVHE